MEISITISLISSIIVGICTWLLNLVWLRPKKAERMLRAQGFDGNSYRLLHGDLKEMSKVIQQSNSNPSDIHDDILPRALPFQCHHIQKYGVKCFQWLGTRPVVYITDPQLVKEALLNNYQFHKQTSNPLTRYVFSGIMSQEEDKWAKQRKLLNPAFHMEKLRLMMPALYLSCIDTLSKWENIVASSKGSSELDVWPHIQTLTADAISRTAFGSYYEEGGKVFDLQKEQSKLLLMAVRSFYLPGMSYLPTKRNLRMKSIAKEAELIITNIINKRIKAIKAGEARADDLLGILLESNLKEIQDQGNELSAMSIHDIAEECKVFYFAGQETTSILLVWTMVLLCKHPEWQTRAREEVLQEFGYEKPGFDKLNHLRVVTMILNEVLRFYSPVPVYGRKAPKEMKLGNLTIPAGAHIQFPVMLIHHDIGLWGADAKEFKPERFSEGVLKATKGNASFFPFGGGPRICMGQNFAMLEVKLAVSLILQRFSFELSPSYVHAPYNVLTLQPRYGVPIILHKI